MINLDLQRIIVRYPLLHKKYIDQGDGILSIHTIGSLSKKQRDLHYVNGWRDSTDSIPIYHVDTPHAFNRVVGYARYINSTSGTVLYRGQNELFNSLLPSGARSGRSAVPETILADICADQQFAKFFGLDRTETCGWKEYNYMLIEAALQHYGGYTYCMDFVDNHWCALWFGLYKFENNHYYARNDDGNLYVFLYVAETAGSCVGGMYIGDKTYTVDLRKALPSTFQRPASQHGWVVRQKERKSSNLDDRVVGIIEISVKHAKKWLGDGELLSEENFFPSYTIDQGYKVLLSRQHRSGISFGKKEILPQNTVCNYHMHELFYCSDFEKLLKTYPGKEVPEDIKVSNPLDVFELLLKVGWDEQTCATNVDWSEDKPYVGQSAATAVLLQRWFGGEVCFMSYSKKTHYFNIIDGTVVDLTRSELPGNLSERCEDPSNYTKLKSGERSVHKKYKDKVERLISNCKN